MSISVMILVFMWLLQSQAASTESPDETLNVATEATGETTGEAAGPTTGEAAGPTTGEAAGPTTTGHRPMHNLSRSSPAAEATLSTAPASSLKAFPTNVQTAATATSRTSPPFISTAVRRTSNTEVDFKTTKSPTLVTSHVSHSATATAAEGSTNHTYTTHRPTTPAHTTRRIPTTTQSTEPPAEPESPSPGPTTATVTKSPFLYNQPGQTSDQKTNHGKIVAALIGCALLLMMLGFLLIFIKKRRIQKQQISTTEWAGPSPFLEGGANSEQVERRASNRISLSSFLPQRLSKRLSLLPETEEELRDMTSATTFGDQTCTFAREDVKGSNGTAGGEIQSTEDAPQTGGDSPPSITAETPNLSEDPADPPAAAKAEQNPLVQNSDDLK